MECTEIVIFSSAIPHRNDTLLTNGFLYECAALFKKRSPQQRRNSPHCIPLNNVFL